MINAKEELQKILVGKAKIKCAKISLGDYPPEEVKTFNLPLNFSEEKLTEFFTSIDFEYSNGYGGQNLFGIVWLEDGTWLDRGEYDGSEWWEHQFLPEIPAELK